tara:strand:- start:383 stop:907 length:525 start_codon:yes stop_codon:yes gene_type:complete
MKTFKEFSQEIIELAEGIRRVSLNKGTPDVRKSAYRDDKKRKKTIGFNVPSGLSSEQKEEFQDLVDEYEDMMQSKNPTDRNKARMLKKNIENFTGSSSRALTNNNKKENPEYAEHLHQNTKTLEAIKNLPPEKREEAIRRIRAGQRKNKELRKRDNNFEPIKGSGHENLLDRYS